MLRGLLVALASYAACSVYYTLDALSDPINVFAYYRARTAHLEFVGELYNNTREVGAATGLVVGSRYLLTNNHVVPLESNYRKLTVNVRLGSREAIPISAHLSERDEGTDLAVLVLDKEISIESCPIWVRQEPPGVVPEGTAL